MMNAPTPIGVCLSAGLAGRRALAAVVVVALGPATLLPTRTAVAASEIRTQRVQFAKGAASATVEGRIQGDETIDYVFGARAGQAANISLGTRHGATYFNLLAPGQSEVAFFNGSVGDNQYEGVLPESGDYRVRVYMMRSAARRNEVADYRLEIVIAAARAAALTASPDAKVAGTPFHATGNLPCAMGGGHPTGSCAFGVVRHGPGNATVTITHPDGGQRVIVFEKGRATRVERSQADAGSLSATREGDMNVVRIGPERYEIPDAVVNGG